MSKHFSKTESQLRVLFSSIDSFNFRGKNYIVKVVGKPSPPKGECKTDIYILAEDRNSIAKEFKISVKQKNADFLENKIKLERAIEIFGDNTSNILTKSIESIQEAFELDPLVSFGVNDRSRNKIMLGWKFEIMNKKSGKKSGKLLLSNQEKIEVYTGQNLNSAKKNSKIYGVVYENSGVANYILEVDTPIVNNAEFYLNALKSIEDYAKEKELFFACKALNYRVEADKWDGNRSLVVFVDWAIMSGVVTGKIVYNKPLQILGNQIGEKVRFLLKKLGIDKSNYADFEQYLHPNIKKKRY